MLYSRSLLVIYFVYSSVYMSIPISQFIPPPLIPWKPQVCFLHPWLYFCFVNKFICTIFLDSTYNWYRMMFVWSTSSQRLASSRERPVSLQWDCHHYLLLMGQGSPVSTRGKQSLAHSVLPRVIWSPKKLCWAPCLMKSQENSSLIFWPCLSASEL